MPAEAGPFEAFYASPVQHPFLLWCAASLALCFVLSHPGLAPRLRRFCLGLGVLSLADAWLTSNPIPLLGALGGAPATIVPLCFVLAGDLRFLLVALLGTADGDLAFDRARIGVAVGLTLIVPIGSQLVVAALADAASSPRVLFLVYEVSFFALTLALLRWLPALRDVAWARGVAGFVLVYYGLWASADVVILVAGADWGYGLRVVPNVLYYGGLIAFIAWSGGRARARAVAAAGAPA